MSEIKHQTKIKDSVVEVPEQQAEDLIDQLLKTPIKIDDFQPLTRQEIYG